jgi:Putative phage metallopeptidase
MSTKFIAAPEVENVARAIISEHHPHLRNVRVEYLFSVKDIKSKGKEVWGTMRKVSSLAAFLAGETDEDGPGAFFCMVISLPVWKALDAARREALVDHELSHAWIEEKEDGSVSLQLLHHDLEEFMGVVLRRGLWRNEVEQFADVVAQAAQRSLYDSDVEVTFANRDQTLVA